MTTRRADTSRVASCMRDILVCRAVWSDDRRARGSVMLYVIGLMDLKYGWGLHAVPPVRLELYPRRGELNH